MKGSNKSEMGMIEPILRVGIISITTVAGAIWLSWRGPVFVLRGSVPLAIVTPAWYMLSAFPVLGALLADWVKLLFDPSKRLANLELGVQLILLVGLSAVRIKSHIPISGHMLLFAYFLLRRCLVRVPRHHLMMVETAIGLALFLVATYVKLVSWNDPLTWALGITIGVVLALGSRIVYSVIEQQNAQEFRDP
jgi:hypothetical protein